MPRKAAKKKKPANPTFGSRKAVPRPFVGILMLIFGVLAALALIDYNPDQNPVLHSDAESNIVGVFGSYLSFSCLQSIGMAAYAIPLLGFWLAYLYFRPFSSRVRVRKLPPLVFLFTCLAIFSALYQIEIRESIGPSDQITLKNEQLVDNEFPYGWGGWLGFHIYGLFFRDFLGVIGTVVVCSVIGLFSLAVLLFDNLLADARGFAANRWQAWSSGRADRLKLRAEKKKAAREAREKQRKQRRKEKAAQAREKQKRRQADKGKSTPPAQPAPEEEEEEDPAAQAPPPPSKKKSLRPGKSNAPSTRPLPPAKPFEPIVDTPENGDSGAPAPPESETSPETAPSPAPEAEEAPPQPARATKKSLKLDPKSAPGDSSGLRIIAGEETRKAASKLPEKKGDYRFPPMRLLADPPPPTQTGEDETVHQQTADTLVRTLEEFGVKVSPGDVHTGPVITRYDIYPAAGVRVERILNLDKNIALNLKALSVRILAPVPGKGCVGIEVPNKNPQPVFIRDILESEDWVSTKAEIPIALGKDVSGKPLITDLAKMPHLLIAGSTGSGKTVCINSVITSLLYHSSPQDLRFVMIDPKIVEMQVYNKLPHMLVPVVTDPKKVPNALKYLLNEMERRYQFFAQAGVRNIAGYNAKMARNRKEAAQAEERAAAMEADLTPEERAAAAAIDVPRDPDTDEQPPEKLPYVVCIVDELADLMMVAPADIETGIARLAQLARAAGIHLILATQRPSVNVITGVIKANLPSRIAFKVASKVDSRTILDTMGADHLIGKGDMLFLPPGSPDLVRSQGAFVSDEEISSIVDCIHQANGEPEFDERFQQNLESGEENEDGGADGDHEDDLVPKAIEVIRSSKRASTSMLQRRLKIGYNRAARIMDILEDQGIVGPENGSSPREILIDPDA